MRTLRIQLLGDWHLTFDDVPVKGVNSARLKSLLAYLVLHPAPQNRQQLAFQFWSESTDSQARANLRFFLHRLRRALPESDHFLEINESSVRWRAEAPFFLDVAAFENAMAEGGAATGEAQTPALKHAVSLYQGELLPSCYDDWILPERERLRQQYIDALERLSWALENQREYRAAITHAQRLLLADPLHEETYRRLIRLHRLNGDRVNALRTYHTCAAVLERELAVEPSQATRAEYEQLLQASPTTSRTTQRSAPACAALNVPNAPLHNLRLALTSFIGREREIDEVKRLLMTTRLVTLTGAGGTGKTRLALELATQLLVAPSDHPAEARYADGVWLVELAALRDPALVLQEVARTLGVQEQRRKSLPETLAESLQGKRLLLVLDNCEHLIGACAEVAETLLRSCPGISILATSREPLKITGETSWLVPPLSLLGQEALSSEDLYEKVRHSEAVRLFSERAVLSFPTFELTRDNAPAVVQICRKLDRLPLAIELAAARVKILTVKQIAARLDNRFNLLKEAPRRSDARHRSLRAVIDWSYELLTPPERLLFERLSVFAGGFTLEDVEAVCVGDGIEPRQVLELVSLLADKSLITVAQDQSEVRFDLLETIRQYATEKLLEGHQAEAVQSKHTAYYLSFAERGNAELRGPNEGLWLERLESEHDNLRVTLQRVLEREDLVTALRISNALGSFWSGHGHQPEGRRWLEATLARNGDSRSPMRAEALLRLGALMILQGDLAAVRNRLEQSRDLWQVLGDKRGLIEVFIELANLDLYEGDSIAAHRELKAGLELAREVADKRLMALALFRLGSIMQHVGDTAAAAECFEESIELSREVGWSSRVARGLCGSGEVARIQGDFDRAQRLYQESLALYQELGDKLWIAILLSNIGFVYLHRKEETKAKAAFVESLKSYSDLNAPRLIPESLVGLAGVIAAGGESTVALNLLAAASALRESSHVVWEPPDRAEFEWIKDALRKQLDQLSFDQAWTEGSALSQGEAVELALTFANR